MSKATNESYQSYFDWPRFSSRCTPASILWHSVQHCTFSWLGEMTKIFAFVDGKLRVAAFEGLFIGGISAYFEQAFRGRTSFDEDARREGGAAAIGALLAAYRRLA